MHSGVVEETIPDPSADTATFWQAIVQGETHAAQETARRILGQAPLVSSTYSFEAEGEGEIAGESRPAPITVEPETPGPTVELWNQDAEVPFVVISAERFCLARLGTSKAKEEF